MNILWHPRILRPRVYATADGKCGQTTFHFGEFWHSTPYRGAARFTKIAVLFQKTLFLKDLGKLFKNVNYFISFKRTVPIHYSIDACHCFGICKLLRQIKLWYIPSIYSMQNRVFGKAYKVILILGFSQVICKL